MCGIAAIIAPPGGVVDQAALENMIRALGHRGPDGFRVHVQGRFGLAHARLSIIDLEGGWQPLEGPRATRIVGNGEIYNYIELARDHDLAAALKTGSDFEPFLHLFAQHGAAVHEQLRGMYALALTQDGRALIVRDPFGIKPLYVCRGAWGAAFASEPRAFFAAGFLEPEIVSAKLVEALDMHYTNGPQTVWRGVERVMPGAAIAIDQATIAVSRRRAFTPRAPKMGDYQAALQRLDQVLEDSVKVHLRADVPFGLFLSGGIDSASVATLTARFATRGVAAFTCGFDVPGAADERAQAEKVARHFGYDFEPVEFTADDFWRRLPTLAWAFDEPCADYAALPVHKLAEVARGRLRVVLTGEGGDELFGGYGRYRKAMSPLSFLRRRGPQARFERAGLLQGPTPWRKDWQTVADGARGETDLQRAQSIDIETWLHADLLLKLDRCLMAYGLEGRTPFLDPQVAAFAEDLPDAWKVRGRFGKTILRDWLAAHCPPAQPFARKQGFTVPVGDWIAAQAARLGPLIAADPVLAQVVKPDAVRALFAAYDPKAHGGLAWSLLFHAVWAGVHIHGRPADGDVWAALG